VAGWESGSDGLSATAFDLPRVLPTAKVGRRRPSERSDVKEKAHLKKSKL